MALLFQTSSRAVHVLLFAALGASAATSMDAVASPAAPKPVAATAESPGGKLYALACATCHMPDGSGVPGLQPALMGGKDAAGPPATVIKVLLLGPDNARPADHRTSGIQTPQLESLS